MRLHGKFCSATLLAQSRAVLILLRSIIYKVTFVVFVAPVVLILSALVFRVTVQPTHSLYTYRNVKLPLISDDENVVRQARLLWDDSSALTSPFIGISISGGGSRAANFGAAALEELNKLGILRHATAISSVSGGSLPTAYYGLFHQRPDWKWETLRKKMATDYLAEWLKRLIYPQNIFLYFATDFDRSDLMSEVFDDLLFEGSTFADLSPVGPRIFINATELTSGTQFTFTDGTFRKMLGSRLDVYPVSEAVMASGAFPGAFHNVTLRNFRTDAQLLIEDIFDARSLVLRLINGQDPATKHVRKALDVEKIRKLEASLISGDMSNTVRTVLNDTFLAPSSAWPYDPDALASIEASPYTARLQQALRESSATHTGPKINRELLAAIYPNALRPPSPVYRHLYDGGASDNLGIGTLERALQTYSRQHMPQGCLIIIVDAYADMEMERLHYKPDTRQWIDYFIDHNAWYASSALLSQQRFKALVPWGFELFEALGTAEFRSGRGKNIECLIWHIGFSRLVEFERKVEDPLADAMDDRTDDFYRILHRTVSSIETSYRLTGPPNCSSQFLQARLYDAARILISEDDETLKTIYKWFSDKGLNLDTYDQRVSPIISDLGQYLKVGSLGLECKTRKPT